MSNNCIPKCWNRQVKRLFLERKQLNRKKREARQALEKQTAASSDIISNSRSTSSASYFKNIVALVPLPKAYDDSHIEDVNSENSDKKEEEKTNRLCAENISSMDILQPTFSSFTSFSPTYNNSSDTLQMADNSPSTYQNTTKDKQGASSIMERNFFAEEEGNLRSNPIIVPCEKCIIEEMYNSSKPHCSTRDVRCPFRSVNLSSTDISSNIIYYEEGVHKKSTKKNDKVSVITDDLKRISI